MPDRAGSTPPEDVQPRPGLRLTDGVPAQDDVASRRARLRWLSRWFAESDPGKPRRFEYGDLLDGGIAVAALLVMVALGVTPWLAIPLAIIMYIAVALLRPAREGRDQTADVTAAE
jgi:hypothetical protein